MTGYKGLNAYKASPTANEMGNITMVTCTNCGASNEDDARFCVSCGSSLSPAERTQKREDTCFGRPGKRVEEECFGLPYGGAIVGIILGVFIIIIGLSISLGLDIGTIIGPAIAIIIGILIVAGALYGLTRRRKG